MPAPEGFTLSDHDRAIYTPEDNPIRVAGEVSGWRAVVVAVAVLAALAALAFLVVR